MHFVDVFIRQAHPGERHGHYQTYEQKLAEARQYKRDESLPWPVLVDDLAGTTHQTYGNLPDPVYLIDADGRVAFYGMWTHVPTLQQAIEKLLSQGGRSSSAPDRIDRVVHMFSSFVGGWRGLQRGGLRAMVDYEIGTPPGTTLTFLGHLARPLLAPIAQRPTPLPMFVRLALAVSLSLLATLWWRRRD